MQMFPMSSPSPSRSRILASPCRNLAARATVKFWSTGDPGTATEGPDRLVGGLT